MSARAPRLVPIGSGGGSYKDALLALNPVAYWRLGEASGDFLDSSGNARTATATGSTITYGQVGALAADSGASTLFNGGRGVYSAIVTTTSFSLLAWINPVALAGDFEAILAASSSNGLYVRSTGLLDFFDSTDHLSTTALTTGSWFFVGVSVNAGSLTFYRNGVADGTASSINSFSAVVVGGNAGAQNVNAYLQEASIFGYPLSQTQIQQLYLAGIGQL